MSGGLAAVVLQQPAEPLLASDLSVLAADPLTIRGEQQHIAFALVVSFLMISIRPEVGRRLTYSDSENGVLGVRRQEEHANRPRQFLQRAEPCQHELPQVIAAA